MSKFKVGDIIRRASGGQNGSVYEGDICKVVAVNRETNGDVEILQGKHSGIVEYGNNFEYYELVENYNIKSMSILNKIKLARKSEPEKSFIKAGIMTMDEKFTPEGKELWEQFQYQKDKEAFKAYIEPTLKELEAEQNK